MTGVAPNTAADRRERCAHGIRAECAACEPLARMRSNRPADETTRPLDMSFLDAMAALRDGGGVARRSWKTPMVVYHTPDDPLGRRLTLKVIGGQRYSYGPPSHDAWAVDWYAVPEGSFSREGEGGSIC